MIEIRLATPEDAPAVARLNRLFNDVEAPAEAYAARLAAPERVDYPILAEIAGQAIGIANLRLLQPVFYAEPYAEVTELFVEEAYRRQGVGKALMQFAEQMARQAGADEILLLTGFDNQTAQAFYQAIDYERADLSLTKKLTWKD